MTKQTFEYRLRAEFHNGQTYVFYGSTKKEATNKLLSKFGNKKGFNLTWTKEEL